VREPRRRTDLAQEALAQLWLRGERGRQELDRDRALERDVAREVDYSHPAAAELPVYLVAACDRTLQCRELVRAGRHWVNCVQRNSDASARMNADCLLSAAAP
jgi:hypothetical protein